MDKKSWLILRSFAYLLLFILIFGAFSACERKTITPEEQALQDAMIDQLSYVKHKDMIEMENGTIYMVAHDLDRNGEKRNWIITLKKQHYASHEYVKQTLAMLAPHVKHVYYQDQDEWAEAAANYLW